MANEKIYDVLVIGGGPAGYTAALYAVRAGLSCLVIEKMSAGGQMCETMHIDNYPGLADTTDGFTLGAAMAAGAARFGAETVQAEVTSLDLSATPKTVLADSGSFAAHTVILATGATHRHMGLDRERELVGRGVGYCATCDGMFYRGRRVVVIGGGNSAVADALYLAGICEHVTLVHRRDTLRASKVHHAPLAACENVTLQLNSEVVRLMADERLTGVEIREKDTGRVFTLPCDGVFISIGRDPVTALVRDQLTLDETGYIVADETTKTDIPGVFAAGDVRTKPLRQIVTATADGATAAYFAEQYLQQNGL
ncbi:MAG: thioredoxin-disulfide reductase [Clostridia bacterium]|nr:thioredoxin-disulfide reductase [Clostridia bacterium]